jgi:cytochrome c peroxidase
LGFLELEEVCRPDILAAMNHYNLSFLHRGAGRRAGIGLAAVRWPLVAAAAVALSFGAALADSAAPSSAELRAKAKEFFGPLPDKMPGCETDTPDKIELGRKLYFEKRLSLDNTISCNSCHQIEGARGGVDNEPTSPGVGKKRGDRNSPTTLNAGFHFLQFWDGRAPSLREQAKGPVLNPVEMAMPSEEEVVKRLKADADYAKMFGKAFPAASDKVTYDNMAEAIAAFERTLITRDRFDDFQKGDDKALSAQEQKGLNLVLSLGCTTCHVKPSMGGTSFQKVGLIHPYETEDIGREKVSKDDSDRRKFKVPSLRNVALTAPYFHDGRIATLQEAVTKMAYHQLGKELSADEANSIVAFLNALTDKARVAAR